MVREVGPIAESVLNKYLGTVRQARAGGASRTWRSRATARSTRRPSSATWRGCRRSAAGRRSWTRLNELLYAELLAVKRTLGPDHETALVRELRPPR